MLRMTVSWKITSGVVLKSSRPRIFMSVTTYQAVAGVLITFQQLKCTVPHVVLLITFFTDSLQVTTNKEFYFPTQAEQGLQMSLFKIYLHKWDLIYLLHCRE